MKIEDVLALDPCSKYLSDGKATLHLKKIFQSGRDLTVRTVIKNMREISNYTFEWPCDICWILSAVLSDEEARQLADRIYTKRGDSGLHALWYILAEDAPEWMPKLLARYGGRKKIRRSPKTTYRWGVVQSFWALKTPNG